MVASTTDWDPSPIAEVERMEAIAAESKRLSIDDIEKLVNAGADIEILPDGTIVVHSPKPAPMPLTFRQDLGDEY
jgi:hypothetical protein